MALQLVDTAGGGEVTLVSMAPNSEVCGLRTALAMGAAKAILVSDDALEGSDALGTAKVLAAAIKRVEGADLVLDRHRVDRRLHRHRARADRRAARPAVGHLRQARSRSTAAPSRSSARPRPATTRSSARCRAVVSVTAGVVEPRYPSFKGIMAAKSKPVDEVTVADLGIDARRSAGPAPARRSPRSTPPPSARPARSSRTTATAREDRRVPRAAQGHLRDLRDTWLFPRSGSSPRPLDGKVATITLELLTKARELGGTVEASTAAATPTRSPPRSARTAPPRCYATGDLGGALPGVPVAAAIAATVERPATAPT